MLTFNHHPSRSLHAAKIGQSRTCPTFSLRPRLTPFSKTPVHTQKCGSRKTREGAGAVGHVLLSYFVLRPFGLPATDRGVVGR